MAYLIYLITRILIFVIIADVILSYFMSPYHPVRETLDRIVEPMLAPIRNVMPYLGGIDFSPIVLILLIQLLGSLLISIF